MNSKLIKTMKLSGYTEDSRDGPISRLLKPAINNFSLGFLIGKFGRENTISIQWGLVHHPMWELQQEIEDLKKFNIQFLLFSDSVHSSIAANASEQSDDFQIALLSLQKRIKFMESQGEKIISDVINSLESFAPPTVFSYKGHLLEVGMAHYYGLLYKYLNKGTSVDEIDSHIMKLLKLGMNKKAPPIFKLGLLRSHVGN